MKSTTKVKEVSTRIMRAFEEPGRLPKALAPIFIRRKDDTPCRKWSWRNQLLTALQGTHDARGYRQWQTVDRHVLKGAKAFHILSPCMKKAKDKTTGDDITICYGFKATAVFALEDTEGADIPTGDPALDRWVADLPLRAVADSWGITVATYTGEPGKSQGRYQQTKDGERKSIALGVQNVGVFLHELMHAADYRLGNKTEKGQHWRSETVAEFGSAVLAECLGLESDNTGGAYRYIESYAKTAEKTVQAACMEVLDRICKAVALVLDTAETLDGAVLAVA